MVGGEWGRQDDPSWTVRSEGDWAYQPQRYIWSRRSDFDQKLKVFNDDGETAEVVSPQTIDEWEDFLDDLGSKNMTSLLLEGGGELAASALQAGVVDEVQFFIATKILGGRDSRTVVAGENPMSVEKALVLQNRTIRHVGNDLLVQGFLSEIYKGYSES